MCGPLKMKQGEPLWYRECMLILYIVHFSVGNYVCVCVYMFIYTLYIPNYPVCLFTPFYLIT